MSQTQLEKQTSKNVQDKASVIWETATHLYGTYKPHEYGKVILPMTVIKRFDDALVDTKDRVIEQYNKFRKMGSNNTGLESAVYQKLTGYKFYNTSKFTLAKLTEDPDNIRANFEAYLRGYSENVIDIINNFNFFDEIKKMDDAGLLNTVITEFCSKKASMKPDEITSADMGYIFEELIRKFSESYDEQAGAHFTARDIIYLMTELLVINDKEKFKEHGIAVTAYDMAMGTSQMLGCLTEKLQEIDPNAKVTCYGQEINNETYAIAKSDMLIKGGDAENMKWGDTLSQDKFGGYEFDYIISNPPFGIDWKKEKEVVEKEHALGELGRFEAGLPAISDGQMLFLQNGIKKLKSTGRMAIIQNGSSLFAGDAGSGPSDIRKFIIENDYLEAVIQLPNDLFYNTGITTYIWIITKDKPENSINKVKLIDASLCYEKRRKNIGNKRVELNDKCIELIKKAYTSNDDCELTEESYKVSLKIKSNDELGYTKVTVETAETDKNGNQVIKKGKPQAIKGKTDFEIIPLNKKVDEYMKENVLPFNPNAFIYNDDKGKLLPEKNKIGYEIPFLKLFYKFSAPESSDEILKKIIDLNKKEKKLFDSIRGVSDEKQ